MRFWILLSFLLAPAAAQAADECPMADGWYRRWANCDQYLRPMGDDQASRVRAIVEAHTVESGSAVTWEEEAEAVFYLLPADLQQREALSYIQCREFAAGRICRDDWLSRSECLTLRRGVKGMEFTAGTTAELELRSGNGVDVYGRSAALPAGATVETTGDVRHEDGRLLWKFGYGHGGARIRVPESAGPWTLAFDELATKPAGSAWRSHALGYASGQASPLKRQLRPETKLKVSWSCPAG